MKIHNSHQSASPIFVICGGIHPPALTQSFVTSFQENINVGDQSPVCVIPNREIAPYDVKQIDRFLNSKYHEVKAISPLVFIGFSAGVVGVLGAARKWQREGGLIRCLFAFDGWGVPLWESFPCHRLSHDSFSHHTAHLLGGSNHSFYAEPMVDHLDLWGNSLLLEGYFCIRDRQYQQKMTIVEFLNQELSES